MGKKKKTLSDIIHSVTGAGVIGQEVEASERVSWCTDTVQMRQKQKVCNELSSSPLLSPFLCRFL